MNIQDPTLVIVRGINQEWIAENFTEMWIGFGGSPVGVPVQDAKYVGLYLGAPVSKITHIGIVDRIEPDNGGKSYYLKVIIKLDKENQVDPGHAIRKHEYWHLKDFGLSELALLYKTL